MPTTKKTTSTPPAVPVVRHEAPQATTTRETTPAPSDRSAEERKAHSELLGQGARADATAPHGPKASLLGLLSGGIAERDNLGHRAIPERTTTAQRRALAGTYADVVQGNNDGIVDPEVDGAVARLGRGDKADFGRRLEKTLGKDVAVAPEALDRIPKGQRDFYKAVKYLQAKANGRDPSEIGERVVGGAKVAVQDPVTSHSELVSHSLFVQDWQPKTPNGDVVVISPAYQATGRWWSRVANAANHSGIRALAMDHEHAGFSAGQAGRFDGASLAAACALMLGEAEKTRSPGGKIRMVGESLGAAALLCGVVLAYNGKITLPEGALPKGEVYVAMVNPYLGKLTNHAAELAGGLLKGLPFSLPTREFLTDVIKDKDAEKRFNHMVQLEEINVHPSGLVSSREMIQHVLDGLESGALKLPPNLKFGLLLSKDDASVELSETARLEKLLAPNLVYEKVVEGKDHALVFKAETHAEMDKLVAAPLS